MTSIYPRPLGPIDELESSLITRVNRNTGLETTKINTWVLRRQWYRDTATVSRPKPLVPHSAPTALKRMQNLYIAGRFEGSYTTASNLYVAQDLRFTQTGTYNGWFVIPAVSGASNQSPSITRFVEAEYLLGNKLLRKIKDKSLSLPVTFLEARQTASWIASRHTSLAKAIQGTKQGKWQRVRNALNGTDPSSKRPVTLVLNSKGRLTTRRKAGLPPRLPDLPPPGWHSKNAAERWLEVQFAAIPLYEDIVGGAEILAKLLEVARQKLVTRTAKGDVILREETWKAEARWSWDGIPSYPRVTCTQQSRVFHKMVCTYKIRLDPLAEYLANLKESGMLNLPSAAFERLRLSFVINWGVTIGTFLELLDATYGCDFIAGSLSRTLKSETTAHTVEVGAYGARLSTYGLTAPMYITRMYDREVMKTFPSPMVVMKAPLSTSKTISAAALWRQLAFGGK